MAVKKRMSRAGANRDISFRVVVADGRAPRDGKIIENVGWYDPKKKGTNFALKLDRIEYWKSHGAVLSDTVASLVRKARKQAASVAVPVAVPPAEATPATA